MNLHTSFLNGIPCILAEKLKDPDLYYPGIKLSEIEIKPEQLSFPEKQIRQYPTFYATEPLILPMEMNFGESWHTMKKKNGMPLLAVNNAKRIDSHIVYLYRHQYADKDIMTQFHLTENELRVVIESFDDPDHQSGGFLHRLIHIQAFRSKLDIKQGDLLGLDHFFIEDIGGNLLEVSAAHRVRLAYY